MGTSENKKKGTGCRTMHCAQDTKKNAGGMLSEEEREKLSQRSQEPDRTQHCRAH